MGTFSAMDKDQFMQKDELENDRQGLRVGGGSVAGARQLNTGKGYGVIVRQILLFK